MLYRMDFKFFYNELLQKLKSLEKLTWKQIETATAGQKGKSKNHEVDVSKIIPEAQRRLRDLDLDDFESVFSL